MPARPRFPGRLGAVALLCLLACSRAAFAEAAPLRLGIMPFNSTLALLKTHQPLIAHLERSLGRRVVVHSAADYFTHINQLLAGDYDLAITGPHFGAMAAERGMRLLFRYTAELRLLVVVRNNAAIERASDLRGRRLALPSRLSVASLGGVRWLAENGLQPGRDFRMIEYSSHGAAVAAVAAGEADAAITAHTPLRQVPEDILAQTRVLASNVSVPHVMTLAHERLGAAEIDRIRGALAAFPATAAGQAFFRDTAYRGYVEVSAADLAELRPFVALTVNMMR